MGHIVRVVVIEVSVKIVFAAMLRRSKTHTVSIRTSEAVMVLRSCGRETVSYGDFDQLLDIRLIGSDFTIDLREHTGGTKS